MLASALVSTIVQAGLVLSLAAAIWALFFRRRVSLADFTGLKPARWTAICVGFLMGAGVAVGTLQVSAIRELAAGERSVVASMAGVASGEVIAALTLTAVFKTAFSEELLFRGLIGKGLIHALGFWAGNTLQALLFGAVHLLLFLIPGAGMAAVGSLVALTVVTGWINGWLNERHGEGSILPGWTAHGTANLGAYIYLATQ